MDGLKLGVTNQMPRRNQGWRLWTPDFQQIEESFLCTATTATLTFSLLRVLYKTQDDKGHANHLHLPSRLLRMFRLRIDRVQMTNTMTYSSTWPCSLA
jgi:hypothetical protein